jgi:hypothetical protein
LTLALWEDEGAELPDPIAGRAALDALDNVYEAVRPTQSEGDVALSAEQEQAYQRIAGRINRLWSYGNPLDHFLF